jgi:hypothetical protein
MVFGSNIGMRSQKMMEHMEESPDMFFVPACLGRVNVIHDHVPDFFQTASAAAAISGGCDQSPK